MPFTIGGGSGGSSGGAGGSIAGDMFFASNAARDTWTTSNAARLVQGITCAVGSGTTYNYFQWDKVASQWRSANLIFQGSKGDKGDTGSKGDKGDTGETGANVVSGDFIDDNIVFTLSDTSTIELSNAADILKGPKGDKGDTGAVVDAASFVGDDLVFELSDDTSVTLVGGRVTLKGETGAEVTQVEFVNSDMVFTFSDASTKVLLGAKEDLKGDDGASLIFQYSADGSTAWTTTQQPFHKYWRWSNDNGVTWSSDLVLFRAEGGGGSGSGYPAPYEAATDGNFLDTMKAGVLVSRLGDTDLFLGAAQNKVYRFGGEVELAMRLSALNPLDGIDAAAIKNFPIASAVKLGMVKQGVGVEIEADGTLNSTLSSAQIVVCDNEAQMLALPQISNVYIVIRNDDVATGGKRQYLLNADINPSVLANWKVGASTESAVSGFKGKEDTNPRTGVIEATTGDYDADMITETTDRTFVSEADRLKWDAGGGAKVAEWDNTVVYQKGDLVSYENAIFVCHTNMTVADTDAPSSDPAYWKVVQKTKDTIAGNMEIFGHKDYIVINSANVNLNLTSAPLDAEVEVIITLNALSPANPLRVAVTHNMAIQGVLNPTYVITRKGRFVVGKSNYLGDTIAYAYFQEIT